MPEETNQNLILAVGELKGEMKGIKEAMNSVSTEMTAFRNSFDNLEKGRLSKLEIAFAESIGKGKSNAVWFGMLSGGVVSILVALILRYFFRV